jgi:hypothetical protein
MFKTPKISPPPAPAPPPNPPTYASAAQAGPISSMPSIYQGLGSTILTSILGAPDARATQRKSLLGQ